MAGSSKPWENLDIFLDTDDFAIRATLRLQDGRERVVRAIFDDPYLNAELGEYELDTTQPRLTCKWTDVHDRATLVAALVDHRPYSVSSQRLSARFEAASLPWSGCSQYIIDSVHSRLPGVAAGSSMCRVRPKV